MYKWKLTYHLVGGQTVTGVYEGPENESGKVAEKLLIIKNDSFTGVYGINMKSNLLVRVKDISAIDIQPWSDSDEMP